MGANDSVPDSCCRVVSKDCGRGVLAMVEDDIRNKIFVDGCLEILKDKLQEDVIPMMVVYAVVGVILALIELITVVLSCAYVAQITRRIGHQTGNDNWRMGDASRNHAPDETDKLRTTDHETVC